MAAVAARSLPASLMGRESLHFPGLVCCQNDNHFTPSYLHNLVDFYYEFKPS